MRSAGKLVILPFAYPYYPRDIVDAQVRDSLRQLEALGPDLLETVFTRADAMQAHERIRIANPDLVIAVMVSWIEAPNLFDARLAPSKWAALHFVLKDFGGSRQGAMRERKRCAAIKCLFSSKCKEKILRLQLTRRFRWVRCALLTLHAHATRGGR